MCYAGANLEGGMTVDYEAEASHLRQLLREKTDEHQTCLQLLEHLWTHVICYLGESATADETEAYLKRAGVDTKTLRTAVYVADVTLPRPGTCHRHAQHTPDCAGCVEMATRG